MSEILQWFYSDIWSIWRHGGWLMLALGCLALIIYYSLIEQWRESCRWPLAKLLRLNDESLTTTKHLPPELCKAIFGSAGAEACARMFGQLREQILNRQDRRMTFLAILVSTAPLVGLLGTVSGLLTTFRGLSVDGVRVGEQVSSGMYQALITTETGLIVAIPAYIMIYALRRRRDQWAAAITHVESVALRHKRKDVV
ncbi:MAG: MotA/TolQ/ExbB proton channel family protein [Verrucomicrobiota bacterium]